MARFSRIAALASVVFALVLAVTRPVPAHAGTVRAVGPYRLDLFFATTPVYPEEPNKLLIRVTDEGGAPVGGLEQTLRLRVGIPNQVTETMPVLAQAGDAGLYYSDLLLPRAAPYTLNVLGSIRETAVDEKFYTGKDGLDKVIVRGRQYPKGADLVVAFTLGVYLVGLAVLLTRAGLRRRRGQAFGQ